MHWLRLAQQQQHEDSAHYHLLGAIDGNYTFQENIIIGLYSKSITRMYAKLAEVTLSTALG
jgi:hypothetical protein